MSNAFGNSQNVQICNQNNSPSSQSPNIPANQRPSLNITIPSSISVNGYDSCPETPATLVNDSPRSPVSPFQLENSNSFARIPVPIPNPQHPFSSTVNIPEVEPIKPRQVKRTQEEILKENLDNVSDILDQVRSTFGCIGDFLMLLFWSRKKKSDPDHRQRNHQDSVARFLSGHNNIKVADVDNAMYNHRNSQPSWRSPQFHQQNLAFSLTEDPTSIGFARPSLKAWAAQLCAVQALRDIKVLTRNNPDHPEYTPAILPVNNVSWEDVMKFNPERAIDTFRKRTVLLYNLWEYLSVPWKDGKPVERTHRPPHMRILASLTPLINGHNIHVNGYLSLPLGIHLFGSQAHTDIKQLASRMGLSVHDVSARKAIASMTEKAKVEMKEGTVEAAEGGDVARCMVVDNCQRYVPVYESGTLRKSQMKTGTYGCSVKLELVPPGAWDLADHLYRIVANKCCKMSVDSLWEDINWGHFHDSMVLYCVKTLAEEVNVLSFLTSNVSKRFRTEPMAIHRLPDELRTSIQPLGTNAKNELETQGMRCVMEDFNEQIGYPRNAAEMTIEWVGGDGGTFASVERVKKILAPTALSNRDTFRNKIATPEAWHAKHTAIKAISEIHFGPVNSSNPSSLSRLFNCAGLKRPANPKQVDHYPMVHGFRLVWTAMILDCWRVVLGTDDLQSHFNALADQGSLPDFDSLLATASILVQQYVSVAAINRVLSLHDQDTLKNPKLQIKKGKIWTAHLCQKSKEQTAQANSETITCDPDDFDGDHSLANSIAFKMQFGSWLLLDHAIKGGDVGRVMELLKIWIFMFAGSNHLKYTTYLLGLHCLLKYESSEALRVAILNNYLIKFGIEAQERDLMIEHHVFKLEDMVSKAGGNFDGHFYRNIIAPNVDNMIRLNRSLMSAVDLSNRKNTHTSPNMCPELLILMNYLKESELHLFRSTRTYPGHIATDILSEGYEKLGAGGKLNSFIQESSKKAKFIEAIEKEKKRIITAETTESSSVHPNPAPLRPSSRLDSESASKSESGSESESSSESRSELSSNPSSEDTSSDKEEVRQMNTDGSEIDVEQEDEEMEVIGSGCEDNWSDY
ncbi:hypothetical protein K435DRAFT_654641 [Dendrothele bispora CBS 962.96]|uniref:DUF6589 domain-containing protein n=1 Tax=Dendrothele bispora (strain CBS 962.96) TaxID=1314807 RepID=A0A4S8MHJ0_DENBC|nr:hypothetical protein K435DRAFT_654641 [Dendrothele bispora CBS 962.96]